MTVGAANQAEATINWRMIVQLIGHPLLAINLALMILVGLSEGIGLLLLVPLIPLLQGDQSTTTFPVLGDALTQLPSQTATLSILAGFVILVVLRAAAQYWLSKVGLIVQMRLVDGLRQRLVDALMRAEWRYLSTIKQSENRALLVSDIERFGYAVERAQNAAAIAINIVIVCVAAALVSWLLAGIALVIGAVVLLLHRQLRQKAFAIGSRVSQHYGQLYSVLEERLSTLRQIKMLGREQESSRAAADAFGRLRAAQFEMLQATGRARIVFQALAALGLAGIVWLALARLDVSSTLLIAASALLGRALMLFSHLQSAWQDARHDWPALHQITKLTRQASEHQEGQSEKTVGVGAVDAAAIEFRKVSFTYTAEHLILRDINLAVAAGEIVAISGPTGAGKSTLADLAAGLLLPTTGEIAVGGQALSAGARKNWRGAVAYVQQNEPLLNGTVKDNMLWAQPDASETAILNALESASAHFVSELPSGIDTAIGAGGRLLSGGEMQRIAIARALLRKPALLILDEATSALDETTETQIANTLCQMRGKMTILILSHRAALRDLADRQYHLTDGFLKDLQG